MKPGPAVFSFQWFSVQLGGRVPCAVPSPTMLKTESRKLKTSSAFTLVELLVVIAVIAVLSALLMSASKAAMGAVNQATDVSNLRTIGLACLNWANDHNGKFPGYGWETERCRYTEDCGANGNSIPRKLFPKSSPVGGTDFGGEYLSSCDVFYSPSVTGMKNRRKGAYYTNSSGVEMIGYYNYSLPHPDDQLAVDPVLGPRTGPYNHRLTDDPKAVRFCSLFPDVVASYNVGPYTSKYLYKLRLDGAVCTIPYKEFVGLGPTARGQRLLKE